VTDGVPYSSELPKRPFNQERRPKSDYPSWKLGIKANPSLKNRLGSTFILPYRELGFSKIMLILVYVTPSAKEALVVTVSEDYLEVWVDERPIGG